MKKILALLLMSLMLFASCKESGDEKNDPAKEPKKEESFANFDASAESYNVGKYDEAIEKLSEIIEKNSEDSKAYMHRGECYLAKSESDKEALPLAKDDFVKALELDSTLLHAKEGLAYILNLEGKSDEAKELILEILSLAESEHNYATIFFEISDKYCHECGRFEHTEHPEVWLYDKSSNELVELLKPYIEFYKDKSGYWDVNGLKSLLTLGGQSYTAMYDREGKVVDIVPGGLHYPETNFKENTHTYTIGDWVCIANRDNYKIIEVSGDLYNEKGENIGDKLLVPRSIPTRMLHEVTNFKTIDEIEAYCKQYLSEEIYKKTKAEDVESSFVYLENYDKIYYWTYPLAMGGKDSPDTYLYDTAEIDVASENSCTAKIKCKYEYYDSIATWYLTFKFGMEDGRFVILDVIESEAVYTHIEY